MKALIAGFIIVAGALACFPGYSDAATTEADRAIIERGRNILNNPGFESGASVRWTASGGSLVNRSGSNAQLGNQSAGWDSSAAAQTLKSELIGITAAPTNFTGMNGVASCMFKCASGSCTHTITASDGTNDLVTAQSINSSTSAFQRTSVNFVFPASGSVQIKIASVASNEPEVYIDSCYLGLAEGFNLYQVSQATLIGTVTITACSNPWGPNSSSLAAFGTQTGCTYATTGSASAPSTNIPAIKFATLPPGEYILQAEGEFYDSTGAGGGTAQYRFTDGTNNARETSSVNVSANTSGASPGIHQSITYTSAQSNVTLQIYGGNTVGTASSYIYATTAVGPLVIKVYRFPIASDNLFRPDQVPANWNGYHDTTCSWARTNTAYGDPTSDSTCSLVQTSNTNFGTVTTYNSSGNALPGIVFTPQKPSTYFVCATPTLQPGNTVDYGVQLIDGGSTFIGENVQRSPSSTNFHSSPICGTYAASSTAAVTLRLQTKSSSGSITMTGVTHSVDWSIVDISSSVATPLLLTPPASWAALYGDNGAGSTNTKVRNFSNTAGSGGSDWTITTSATLGASIQANVDMDAECHAVNRYTSADTTWIMVNQTTPGTILPYPASDPGFLTYIDHTTTGIQFTGSATVRLKQNAVIRLVTNAASDTSANAAVHTLMCTRVR